VCSSDLNLNETLFGICQIRFHLDLVALYLKVKPILRLDFG